MKHLNVIKINDVLMEWDSKDHSCANGIYTVRKEKGHYRDREYSCSFPQAMEYLAARLITQPTDLAHKLELITTKIQELLPKMPKEWSSKWQDDYTLTTWDL